MQEFNQLSSSYSCLLSPLDITSNETVTNVTGTHLPEKTNSDVQLVDFRFQPNLSFVPKGMEIFFPNIKALYFYFDNISQLFGNELNAFDKLEWFAIGKNPLVNVSGNLFNHNPKMRAVFFDNNQIRLVGTNLLTSLKNLSYANFYKNICTNKYATNAEQIPALIEDLQVNCPDLENETTTEIATDDPSTENPTCGDLNEIVCSIQDQNQILIEKNSDMDSKIDNLTQKNEEMSLKVSEITQKLDGLSQENLELKEILNEIIQGILDLSARPCGF